jgi:hypothetical protein
MSLLSQNPIVIQGGFQRGGKMSRWVQQHVPGAAFAPQVRSTSVAGKKIFGNLNGSSTERLAFKMYHDICGEGAIWGDGIIAVSAALLPGSSPIILDGVSRYAIFGEPWYGSASGLSAWVEPEL